MSLKARRELLASVAPRYQAAEKADKQRILDEFTAATGYHRKYAITRLKQFQPTPRLPSQKEGRSRSARYGSEIEAILAMLWEAAGRICSKRLVPFLPQLVEAMEHHGHLSLSEETRTRCCAVCAWDGSGFRFRCWGPWHGQRHRVSQLSALRLERAPGRQDRQEIRRSA